MAARDETDPYDEVRRIGRLVSNWDRWGPNDERGTLNLIDAAATKRGAACVRLGRGVTLGLEFSLDGPQCGFPPERFNPHRYMTAIGTAVGEYPGFCFSDDVVVMPLQCATQTDALAHVHYDDQMFNGYVANEVLGAAGAGRLDIASQADRPICTRGILLDFCRLRSVERLPVDTAIDDRALDEALAATGLDVLPGDAIVIRTGHLAYLREGAKETYNYTAPGLTMGAVPWLRERDVAMVASDTTLVEMLPAEDPRLVCPVHLLLIREMGMPLGEMYDLDELADVCAQEGRCDFMFNVQPIKFRGGIGSPTNPTAIL
jgi:kynurenine formamidase